LFNNHIGVVIDNELWVLGWIRSSLIGAREHRVAVYSFDTSTWRLIDVNDRPDWDDLTIYSHCLIDRSIVVAADSGLYCFDFDLVRWKPVYRDQGLRSLSGQYHICQQVSLNRSRMAVILEVGFGFVGVRVECRRYYHFSSSF